MTIRCSLVGTERPGSRGQLLDVIASCTILERERPGIGRIGDEQIENRGELRLGEIAAAVGHRAVGDLEERPSIAWCAVPPQRPRQQRRSSWPPARAAADVEEAPAVAARHVLHLHAAEGRQIGDHPVQVQQRIVELNASVAQPEVLPELVEDAPRID
jgi:hypothetical protein